MDRHHHPRPLIGIVLDWASGADDYSRHPHYALNERYFTAVSAAGGLPLAVSHQPELLGVLLGRLQGLILPGGDYPFPADWYAAGHGTPYGASRSARAEFDETLLKEALERQLPVLGICAGMQVLGALHGCPLRSDLGNGGSIGHRQPAFPAAPVHPVTVTPDSLLARLGGSGEWRVNSLHNEAIAEVNRRVRVSARAPDGVIEAIEIPGQRFAVGVQWHPEWLAAEDASHAALFHALVEAARR